jgi:D-sedoheptulose 7-phosphate isomerase
MATVAAPALSTFVEASLQRRNAVSTVFFSRAAPALARVCHEMSERFQRGGRLLAFGRGSYATDAQHVSVEFVHPVIVGKRALPALDISAEFTASLRALARPGDIVVGFAPPDGDPLVDAALAAAAARGAMTLALSGPSATYATGRFTPDAFLHQEVVEMLYHVLWESVHVFFEHAPVPAAQVSPGAADFLYPFLGGGSSDVTTLVAEVASSIRDKVSDDAALRSRVARESSAAIAAAAYAMYESLTTGATLFALGNGGSATDANDLVLDCVAPPSGYHRIPAVSLSADAANITAIANDVGTDVVFVRQLIAHARAGDVLVVFSTSGGSANVVAALVEARKRSLMTVAILGYDGGEVRRQNLADHCIVVPSDYIPRIQEVQASIYHILRESLEALHRGEY